MFKWVQYYIPTFTNDCTHLLPSHFQDERHTQIQQYCHIRLHLGTDHGVSNLNDTIISPL